MLTLLWKYLNWKYVPPLILNIFVVYIISFFRGPGGGGGGPCCVHPRQPVLHFEWVNFPGHLITNYETSSPPLCWSCGLIPDMHLPNYYDTVWINVLDVESSPFKYWPMSINQVGITSVCYIYQKIVILIPHTNIAYTNDEIQF